MKITSSTVTKLLIEGAPSLDPITVFLEDLGPNQGKLIIECYGQSWSAYWGSMGGTLREFIAQADVSYLAGKLTMASASVYDPDGLEAMLKKEVLRERRAANIGNDESRKMWGEIEEMDFEHPFHIRSGLLATLIGDDWHCALPEKPNPDYEYLCRIITAVRAALEQEVAAEVAQ